jgi:hypothetical protein
LGAQSEVFVCVSSVAVDAVVFAASVGVGSPSEG